MQSNENNVIVIGGGMAGLAAATFIARTGLSVKLFEQSGALGGRARTKEQNGFYFNIGPHALYRQGAGMEVLAELGITPRGAPPRVSKGFAVREGVKYLLPTSTATLFKTDLLRLKSKLEIARLLATIARLDGSEWMNASVAQWLTQRFKHYSSRELLAALFRVATYINAPERLSAGAAIEQLKKAVAAGVLYLDEGWQTLVDQVEQAARNAGVFIETGTKIASIERDSTGAVCAARTADGARLEAATIVIASDPRTAAELIGDQQRWVDRASVKAACLDLALDRLPVPEATFALGIDRPLYLSVHSAAARLAPEGGALVHLAKYLPLDHKESAEEDEHELEGLMDLIQPGWRECVAHRRFLPDMTVMNWLPAYEEGGARPEPEVKDAPGLFIAGDWVGREGFLVDAALASAKEAARFAVEYQPALAKKAKVKM
ncbi:MAG: FAD-dependent oxidoreductase [Acidobacteriota bacterium]